MASLERLQVWVNLTLRRAIFLIVSLPLGSVAVLQLLAIADSPHSYNLIDDLPLPLALLCLGIAGLVALSRVLFRPVLEMDAQGIRLLPAWPLPRSVARTLTWEELDRLEVATMYLPTFIPILFWMRFDHLWLMPKEGVIVENGPWETLVALFALGTNPDEAYRIGISPGWSHTLEEVVATARRFRPDLKLIDVRSRR